MEYKYGFVCPLALATMIPSQFDEQVLFVTVAFNTRGLYVPQEPDVTITSFLGTLPSNFQFDVGKSVSGTYHLRRRLN